MARKRVTSKLAFSERPERTRDSPSLKASNILDTCSGDKASQSDFLKDSTKLERNLSERSNKAL